MKTLLLKNPTSIRFALLIATLSLWVGAGPSEVQAQNPLSQQFQPAVYGADLGAFAGSVEFGALSDINDDGFTDYVFITNFCDTTGRPVECFTSLRYSFGQGSKLPFSTSSAPAGEWPIRAEFQSLGDLCCSRFELTDVNGDRLPDLIQFGRNLVVLDNTTASPRFAPLRELVELSGTGHQLVDIDGDRDLDLVFVDGSPSRLFFQRNTGTPQRFGPFEAVVNPISSASLSVSGAFVVGDVDADGDQDIVATGVESSFYLLNSGGAQPFNGSTPVFFRATVPGTDSMRLVDINRDGYADLVTVGDDNFRSSYVMNLGANGLFQGSESRFFVPDATPVADVLFADMDGDGDRDLMYTVPTSVPSGPVFLKLNNGSAAPFSQSDRGVTLALSETERTQAGFRFSGAEDLDNDGDVDFVMNREFLGYTTLYLNNGFSGTPMPVVTVTVADERINEGDNFYELTLTLDRPAEQNIYMEFSTSKGTATPGEDFFGVFERVEFLVGEQAKTLRVQIRADDIPEGDESFNWFLAFVDGANVTDQAGVVIINGLLNLSVNQPTVRESAGRMVFRFSLEEAASRTVRFSVATNRILSEATPGQDFYGLARVVEIPAGERTANFVVPILQDDVNEGPESVVLRTYRMENLRLTNEQAVGYIRDDTVFADMQVNNGAVREGQVGTVQVGISQAVPVPVSVSYTTEPDTALPGVDYRSSTGRITLEPGQTFAEIPVETIDNTEMDGQREITVRIFNAENSTIITSRSTLRILDDD